MLFYAVMLRGRFLWSAFFLECLIWSWVWMTRLALRKSHNLNLVLLKGSFHLDMIPYIFLQMPLIFIVIWNLCLSCYIIIENSVYFFFPSKFSPFGLLYWEDSSSLCFICSGIIFILFSIVYKIYFAVVKLLSLMMSLSINV